MLRTVLFLTLFTVAQLGLAQETVAVSRFHAGGIFENYNVLKSNQKVKQGLYQLITRKKTAIASGGYTNNNRSGIWHFYDQDGRVAELYNYTTKQLLYEAPVDSTKDYVEYIFDRKTTYKDTVTKPVRIGGMYYGYIPYLKLFKIDASNIYSAAPLSAFLQILVSPSGQLAECKLVVKLKQTNNIVDTYVLNNELLNADEKTFIPATINSRPVTATISIYCKINSDWGISFY
jgi:hypothetical protein